MHAQRGGIPSPPNLQSFPKGNMDYSLKMDLEKWTRNALVARKEYQTVVATVTEDLKTQHNAKKREIKSRITEKEREIAVLKKELAQCDLETEETMEQTSRLAKQWYDCVDAHVVRANEIVGFLDETLEPPPPRHHSPPDHLVCPITSELMVEPVVAADGQTYERSAIESVIVLSGGALSKSSSPTSSPTSVLRENVQIRSEIMDYKAKNNYK